MARHKELRPFCDVRNEYNDSFQEYINSASVLYSSITAVMNIVESGGDAEKALRTIKPSIERFAKIAYGD